MISLDRECHKKAALQIAQELHNMRPVLSELDHNGASAIDGKYIYWVECQKCGKSYKWNQLVWQARHYDKCRRIK